MAGGGARRDGVRRPGASARGARVGWPAAGNPAAAERDAPLSRPVEGTAVVGRRAALLAPLAAPALAARARGGEALELFAPSRPFLRPLGGLVLDTGEWGFGGLSGAHLAPDLTLTAVGDRGSWLEIRLDLRADGRALDGYRLLRHGRLRDGAGNPLGRGRNADAESLARLPDGSWLVGFERWHRIRRYRATLDGPALPVEAPPGIEAAPVNAGLEALAVLADGSVLALAEGLAGEGANTTAAWLGRVRADGRAEWRRADYRPAPGLLPTDAAGLPGGGALVLERRFSLFGGFECRLAHVPRFDGPVWEGATWLDLPPDAPAENWEAVGVARVGGRTLVALLSDDNESAWQRSLLALFEVATPAR